MLAPPSPAADVTTDGLLGGRIRYQQPRTGYRTGIEPILLAASIPVRPGERVLEAGTGAGAALLCLATRCPRASGVGIERDPALAFLAQANLQAADALAWIAVAADLLDLPAGPLFDRPFDHALANPPWHAAASTASPDAMRDAAKRGDPALLAAWCQALARRLRHHGSLTLIVPAAATAATLAAMQQAQCGSPSLLPLWPHAGQAARLVLLRAVKGGRGGCRVLPGLTLHDGAAFTPAARAILWDGAALPF